MSNEQGGEGECRRSDAILNNSKKKPHRRNDEAHGLCDAVINDSFRLVLLIYRGLRCASTRPIGQIWVKLTMPFQLRSDQCH